MSKVSLKHSLLLSLICFTSIGYADSCALSEEPSSSGQGPKHMRASARHIESKGVGYERGYTTLETFLAPDQENSSVLPFADLRGHVFDNGKFAANVGLGARWRWGCRAYGINAYYDYRNDRKAFNQVGLGLETLGTRWDFRINGYLPIANKVSNPYHLSFSHFKGNNLILSQKYEFAMKGADAEAGAHFGSRDFDFFGGAGPYYFIGHIGPHAWGGKARLSGMWKEYIGLEVSGSYDNVFHGIVQGQVFFSVPFGPRTKVNAERKHCKTSCRSARNLDMRMVQPVIRDEIIVLNKRHRHSVAIDPSTKDPYVFWFVDNTSHSAGTFKSPFNTLLDAQNASLPNDVIYVFPGDSTSTGLSDGILMQDGQQLLGATTSHSLQTTVGTVTITPQASGNLPLLTSSTGNVVTLANNNVVSGLYIQNVNGHGIYGDSVNNTTATQNIIQGSAAPFSFPYNGVEWDNVTGTATLSGNTITSQNYCVLIDDTSPVSNTTYSLTNNLMDNNLGASGYITYVNFTDGSNNTLRFSGNSLIGSPIYGLGIVCANATPNIAHTFVVSNNYIAPPAFPVYVTADGTTLDFTVTDNSFVSTEGSFAAYLNGASYMTTTISGNSFISEFDAITLESYGTSTLSGSITNNTFTTTSIGLGLDLVTLGYGNISPLYISNNTFTGGVDGILFSNGGNGLPSFISLTNNSFNAQSGIGFYTDSNGASSIGIDILANTFQAGAGNAVFVSQSGTGTTCLTLTNNSTDPVPSSYFLSQTGGIFNLQVPMQNIGELRESGTINLLPSCE